MNSDIFLSFFLYISILLCIGLISLKKQKTDVDFVLGDRSLNFWVTALSAHASDMSSWLFMAYPAAIFVGGLFQSWIAWGLIAGMFINWQFIAAKLRTATEKYNSYTLPTFFEKRFDDQSGLLRIVTAFITVFFLTCYLSAGLIAMGLLLESVFNIDYFFGLTIAILVVVTYVFAGGFTTVAWTDLFQALFLIGVIAIVPIIAFFKLPEGFTSIIEGANHQNVQLTFLPDFSLDTLITILFLISWGLGYLGQPHIVTKFLGIRDANDLYKSKYLGMSWQIIALLSSAAVGIIGLGYFSQGLSDPQLVFVEMVNALFTPFFSGFILCAVLAANMSTMDSQILVCASVLSEDFYKHVFRKKASPKELLFVSRICVIIIAMVSLLFAFNRNSTILEAVRYAWSGLGCSFGPLMVMSLYSCQINKYGAFAGIMTGSLLAAGWHLVNPYLTAYTIPSEIPGFFLSLLVIYFVSKLTRWANFPSENCTCKI